MPMANLGENIDHMEKPGEDMEPLDNLDNLGRIWNPGII
jgi:hypothetical protein